MGFGLDYDNDLKHLVYFQSGIEVLKHEPKNEVKVSEKKEGRKLRPPGYLVQPQSPLLTTIMPGEASDHLTRLLRDPVLPYPVSPLSSFKVRERSKPISPGKLHVFHGSSNHKFIMILRK